MAAAWVGLDNRLVRSAAGRVIDRAVSAARPHCRGPTNSRSISEPIGAVSRDSDSRKGRTVAAPRKSNSRVETTSYLRTAEVADLLHVSPKTVSRWAKEGKLPFLKTLGGHRRYPEARIRELAAALREEPTG